MPILLALAVLAVALWYFHDAAQAQAPIRARSHDRRASRRSRGHDR